MLATQLWVLGSVLLMCDNASAAQRPKREINIYPIFMSRNEAKTQERLSKLTLIAAKRYWNDKIEKLKARHSANKNEIKNLLEERTGVESVAKTIMDVTGDNLYYCKVFGCESVLPFTHPDGFCDKVSCRKVYKQLYDLAKKGYRLSQHKLGLPLRNKEKLLSEYESKRASAIKRARVRDDWAAVRKELRTDIPQDRWDTFMDFCLAPSAPACLKRRHFSSIGTGNLKVKDIQSMSEEYTARLRKIILQKQPKGGISSDEIDMIIKHCQTQCPKSLRE